MRDRSKREYGVNNLTAPTKLECLEFVEKEKEMESARLADLMKIDLNHVSWLLRGFDPRCYCNGGSALEGAEGYCIPTT